MKLIRMDIRNFRFLKEASIRMDNEGSTTILVGPNNSGKTSVAEALLLFTKGAEKSFSLYDFSLACREDFEKAQALILAAENDEAAICSLPVISMDLHFEYSEEPADLAVAADLLMDLDPASKRVTLRMEYAAVDPVKLAQDFRESRKEDESLFDFLLVHLGEYFGLSYHKVVPEGGGEKERLDDKALLNRLIKCDFVFAQRHIDDQENTRALRLSHLLHDHYEKHYKDSEPEDHEDIENTLQTHAKELGGRYMKAFEGLITNLKTFGYPQRSAPSMSIKAELNSKTLFRDHTRIYYGNYSEEVRFVGGEEKGAELKPLYYELPEKYNGLGFKNLIYMVLQIQSFRVALERMPTDRPRVHLIFIEEPETHLHPQVQSVFIRQISAFLKAVGKGEDAQIILTTHSSHIIADCGFTPIRYFRRGKGMVDVKDLLDFEKKLETPDAARFLTKYMSVMRCDLFFADKAIAVEGQVERLLMPKMIAECARKENPDFSSEYISILEVGGAHAHKFKPLLKFIEVPTLIITDLDAVNGEGKACPVANGEKTSNAMLKSWLPGKTTLVDLKAADEKDKIEGCIRVTYQLPENGTLPCGRSFEEAFIYRNAEWLLSNLPALQTTGTLFDKKKASALIKDAFNIKPPKVDLALDLMIAEGWETPLYIAEGLKWLATFGGI